MLKTALRRCRKYYQTQLYEKTKFVCSKKEKVDDPFIPALHSFMEEFSYFNQNLKVMLFLGALTYPSDSKRNVEGFLVDAGAGKDTKRVSDQI